jgi:putative membrane protein
LGPIGPALRCDWNRTLASRRTKGADAMMYYGHGMGVGWSLMIFAVVLPLLLIAGAILAGLIRRSAEKPGGPPAAEQVLADRLARGEIDSEEYETRLRTLRAAR